MNGILLVFSIMFAAGLTASFYVFAVSGDPLALLRSILRLLVVVPLATGLAILAVRAFDELTPPVRWLEEVARNELAAALVLASLIFGVFWLCIQG
jgi:hypothetical protein